MSEPRGALDDLLGAMKALAGFAAHFAELVLLLAIFLAAKRLTDSIAVDVMFTLVTAGLVSLVVSSSAELGLKLSARLGSGKYFVAVVLVCGPLTFLAYQTIVNVVDAIIATPLIQ